MVQTGAGRGEREIEVLLPLRKERRGWGARTAMEKCGDVDSRTNQDSTSSRGGILCSVHEATNTQAKRLS